MTDNEIIKALEMLLDKLRAYECKNVSIDFDLITNILKLIDRLQHENKNLMAEVVKQKKKVDVRNLIIAKLKPEIDRLTTLAELGNQRANDYRAMRDRALKAEKEVDRLSQEVMYNDSITEMKVDEAREEFVEKLCKDRVSNDPVVIAAKCLLKEMEGAAK